MQLYVEWHRPIPLKDGTKVNLIYFVDLSKLPETTGVYIFGRRWGSGFEALYVGKATKLRARVKGQFNNLRLMQHVRNAKAGKRVLIAGRLITKPGQRAEKALSLAERALIRYFLSEGHDLVNKQGTRLRRHELLSSGKHPKRFLPSPMYLEKAKGE
jgi:hypothetical protein